MEFSIVVAMDEDRGIGKEGGLPWRLPADLRHFKRVTTETRSPQGMNAVVMGRKTWESLPERYRPLPSRLNIVLTRDKSWQAPVNVAVWSDLSPLSSPDGRVFPHPVEKIFVIGGGRVFEETINLPHCTTLYVTHLKGRYNCDTFFPSIPAAFGEVESSEWSTEEGETYRFSTYKRSGLDSRRKTQD